MQGRLAVACSVLALTLLGFFVFPGHTYLQSDTQIYVPMLEHIWDPSTLKGDLVAAKPHLAFTLYDEISIALRWLTRAGFEAALTAQQLCFRAVEIVGMYLLARAFPLSRGMSLLVAALGSLGATIAGPAILSIEYEPVPRGFALALVLLAVGLAARERRFAAGIAGAGAVLYQAPTALPFWIVFAVVLLRRRDFRPFAPLLCALALLVAGAGFQAGAAERQSFFFRIDPELEALQRMRAPYNWVSTWIASLAWQYLAYWLIGLAAFWRVRPAPGRELVAGLPLVGMLSVPVSYILLERLKWGFIPQFQPARALVFVTVFAVLLSAAAGIRAAEKRVLWEAALWFALVFAVPMQGRIRDLRPIQIALCLSLALLTAATLTFRKQAAAVPAVAAFLLLPTVGQVHNYPKLEDASVDEVATFLRVHSPPSACVLFANAGRSLVPGIVRVRSLRSVYVDWKSGGQANYYRSLAMQWWSRWEAAHALEFRPEDLDSIRGLPVDYVLFENAPPLSDVPIEFRNGRFSIYRLSR